jgi:hypothetical protein
VTDLVAENLPQQELSAEATIAKLSGKGGVFVGGDDDLAAAQKRYDAMQAVEAGTATSEQRTLLSDLDSVLQNARQRAEGHTYRPAPRHPYAYRDEPNVTRYADRTMQGMPTPPRRSPR